MRPTILNIYFTPLEHIHGIGPKTYNDLQKICGPNLIDLLYIMPRHYTMRHPTPALLPHINGHIITLDITILRHQPPPKKSIPYKIIAEDSKGTIITLLYFRGVRNWLEKNYPLHTTITISGKSELYNNNWQMIHPDYAVLGSQAHTIPTMEPVYPQSGAATSKKIQSIITQFLPHITTIPEWIDARLYAQYNFMSFHEALHIIHAPTQAQASLIPIARQRLALDEIATKQVALKLMRNNQKIAQGKAYHIADDAVAHLRNSLPFTLTHDQQAAYESIKNDIVSSKKMLRLLQGDVGAGKTIVAFMAMVGLSVYNTQSLLMAPTDILAKQHYANLCQLITTMPNNNAITIDDIVLLTGKMGKKQKNKAYDIIAHNPRAMVIGTHAVFQNNVSYHNLGLIIIDEQHRFGVEQRLSLHHKQPHADMLIMSATPIPRTLTMSVFGDIDVTIIQQKPSTRKNIITTVRAQQHIQKLLERISHKIQDGEKIFWVCPLIDDSDELPLISINTRVITLQQYFGHSKVSMLHGKMSPHEKDNIMEQFIHGDIDILCATTVIEVGVDVPQATIMVIDNAEHFGLAQLHQLRGRVGRGHAQSYCVLLYQEPLGANSRTRLQALRQSNNGFYLAEQDLQLRGGGDILGTKQSGLPNFRILNLFDHHNFIDVAHKLTTMMLEQPDHQHTEQWQHFRHYLYLFELQQIRHYLS